MPLLSITLVLFLIMNPIGNISSFLALLHTLPARRRQTIIIREMLIALGMMLLFNYLGEAISTVLGVSEITVRISSAVILFLIAIKILFPSASEKKSSLPEGEPFLVPLAIPMIAGPALLATIMLYADLVPEQSTMLIAMALAWLLSVLILLAAPLLSRLLKQSGLLACEKLVGMVLVLLSIQRFLEGLQLFIHMER